MAVILEKTAGLAAFVRTVESGSFRAAAALLGATPSAVSKSVSKLERRLGTRLLRRSTRSIVPTDEGRAYYERVAPHLRALEEAEDVAQTARRPRGLLRVSVPQDLGRVAVAPWSKAFLARYPEVHLELSATDRFVDLVREGFDLAVRVGDLHEAALTARSLGALPFVVCAAPSYLARRRRPRTVEDLRRHACLRYLVAGRPLAWEFGEGRILTPEGPFASDDGETLRAAAVAGAGVAYLFRFHVEEDLERGRLVALLPDLETPAPPVHLVHAFGKQVPARVRVFVDALVEHFKALGFSRRRT